MELSARLSGRKATRSTFSISPFRLFIGLYLAAFAYLMVHGHRDDALRTLKYSCMFLGLAFLTTKLARGGSESPRRGRNLPLQFALAGAAIVFTGLVSVRLGSEDDTFHSIAGSVYGSGCWQYAAEVCAVYAGLRALGLGNADLGLRRWAPGGTWIAVAWLATAIGFLTSDVIFGVIGSLDALQQVAENVFRNGFSEEFLFRAVLLSRLRLVLSDEWALFAQALTFGIWHYGADIRSASGDPLVTACFMITVQAVFGYALGFLMLRTRSLAIGAGFHAIADATSII